MEIPKTIDSHGIKVNRKEMEEVLGEINQKDFSGYVIPYQFQALYNKFNKLKSKGKELWIEDSSKASDVTKTGRYQIARVDYRKVLCTYVDPTIEVDGHPYVIKRTINYADLVNSNSSLSVKVL